MKSQLDNFTELMTERADYKRALERIVKEAPKSIKGHSNKLDIGSWADCVADIQEIAEEALSKHE